MSAAQIYYPKAAVTYIRLKTSKYRCAIYCEVFLSDSFSISFGKSILVAQLLEIITNYLQMMKQCMRKVRLLYWNMNKHTPVVNWKLDW